MLLNKIGSKFVIFVIRVYQKFISPIKPKRIKCRFHPTCSNYGIEAVNKYGFFKGTIDRLKRCNPYNRDSCIDYP